MTNKPNHSLQHLRSRFILAVLIGKLKRTALEMRAVLFRQQYLVVDYYENVK